MWVQSYMSFKYCPQLIHLWQFMLAVISMKVVAALILYLLIVAILHCVRKMRVFMIIGVSVFLIAEGILAFGKQTVNALQEIPIRMISYGGSEHNISLLVSTNDKVRALQALSKNLF